MRAFALLEAVEEKTTMSLTIEFYSAEPQELKALFAENTPLDTFVQKRQTFPQADFSFHLLLPDDLDNLCQILSTYHPLIPFRFQDVCVGPIWDDGLGTESLTILSEQFARALTECSESDIEQAALAWVSAFFPDGSHRNTLAYQAVRQLQEVARDVMRHKRSFIYHLAGAPAFFEYLRDL